MKIGDDVWAVCDAKTGEIATFKGHLMIRQTEKAVDDLIATLFEENTMVKRQIRLMAVRIGKIPQSEIDGNSKK